MSRSLTIPLCVLMLAASAAASAAIEMKAIYPSTFYDNQDLLVEDGMMVTLQEIDAHYGTMKVYNAENPASPALLSTETVPYEVPYKAFLHNQHVYIPDFYGHFLRRYSLLDPANPVLNYAYQFNMVGYRDLAFRDNHLLMATQSLGLRIINISNENNASEVGSYASNNPLFRVWAHENRAAVLSYDLSSETAVLILLDISDITHPVYAGSIALPGYNYSDPIEVVFYQQYVYVERYFDYTQVYDLSLPNIPMWVGEMEYGIAHGVIEGNVRYTHSGNVFRVQQLTEPLTPVDLAGFDIIDFTVERCVIDRPYAYLVWDGMAFCLELSSLQPPEALVYTFDTEVNGEGLAGCQDWLYYSGNIAHLGPGGDIAEHQNFQGLNGAKDLKVDQDLLFTTDNTEQSTNIFSLADLAAPQLVSTLSGSSRETWRSGNYLILRGGISIRCYDLSDPANPVYLWTLERSVKSLAMEGDLLWIAWQGELETYRMTGPVPLLICSQPLSDSPYEFTPTLVKHGSFIYVSGYTGEILVYDVSDPYASTYVGHSLLPIPDDASDRPPLITPEGDLLVLTGWANQVILYSLDDPGSPEYLAHHSLPWRAYRIVFRNDRFLFKKANLIYCLQLPETSSADDPVLTPVSRLAAYPNPFRQNTAIDLRLNGAFPNRKAVLTLYDLKGRKIRTYDCGPASGGARSIVWDGRDANGSPCPSGIYLARLSLDGKPIGGCRLSLIK